MNASYLRLLSAPEADPVALAREAETGRLRAAALRRLVVVLLADMARTRAALDLALAQRDPRSLRDGIDEARLELAAAHACGLAALAREDALAAPTNGRAA